MIHFVWLILEIRYLETVISLHSKKSFYFGNLCFKDVFLSQQYANSLRCINNPQSTDSIK